MSVGGINGLLAVHSLEEVRARSNRRSGASGGAEGLSDAERKELARLRARDREVRAHEQAHKAVAGAHARGGPKYSTTRGPDGRRYATEGSVSIDTSSIPGEPAKTLAKMQQVRRAALAPSEPSSRDAHVAAEASQKANEARLEIAKERQEGPEGESDGTAGDAAERLATQYGVASSAKPEATSMHAQEDGAKHRAKSVTASSLEEQYARAGSRTRDRLYSGYRLDLRV